MRNRNYRFGGLEFSVILPEEMAGGEYSPLKPFQVDSVTKPQEFCFRFVDRLPLPHSQAVCLAKEANLWVYQEPDAFVRYKGSLTEDLSGTTMRVEYRRNKHEVLLRRGAFRDSIGTKTLLDALALEHMLIRNRGLLFHCAYIEVDGGALLFTAPSQTGKSTQADLWMEYRGAEIINGDRAAIRITEDGIRVEGLPYSGSSPYCKNKTLPLKAIVYLSQAPVTSIRRLCGFEAFARIWEGVFVNTWDRTDLELASETVQRIAETVPVFYMPCTPDESAVETLERELVKVW